MKFIQFSINQTIIIRALDMQVVYAVVYSFMWTFISLSGLLLIFSFPFARRVLQKIQTRYQKVFNNPALEGIINFTFVIIAIILVDSVKSFMLLNIHFSIHQKMLSKIGIQSLDQLQIQGGESMLNILKEQSQYYLAERNIMMTLSALFAYFVFQKLLATIRKLVDEQHREKNPQAESVIPQVIAELARILPFKQKTEQQMMKRQKPKTSAEQAQIKPSRQKTEDQKIQEQKSKAMAEFTQIQPLRQKTEAQMMIQEQKSQAIAELSQIEALKQKSESQKIEGQKSKID